jgi:hypothetical protein
MAGSGKLASGTEGARPFPPTSTGLAGMPGFTNSVRFCDNPNMENGAPRS